MHKHAARRPTEFLLFPGPPTEKPFIHFHPGGQQRDAGQQDADVAQEDDDPPKTRIPDRKCRIGGFSKCCQVSVTWNA